MDTARRTVAARAAGSAHTPRLAARKKRRAWPDARLFALIQGHHRHQGTPAGRAHGASRGAPVPARPAGTGLEVRQGDGFATLSWDPVAGATDYQVERTLAGASLGTGVVVGVWRPNRQINRDEPAFADAGFIPGDSFQWRVCSWTGKRAAKATRSWPTRSRSPKGLEGSRPAPVAEPPAKKATPGSGARSRSDARA